MSAAAPETPVRPADIAHVIAPPPLIYLFPLLGTLCINYWQPWPFLPGNWAYLVGLLGLVGGILLLVPAIRAFAAARTNPKPWKPTKALVFTGPYRFTRNPMYLGFTLIYLGITSAMNSVWSLLGLLVVLPVMEWGVIRREERYLSRKFGEPYLHYLRSVRRWI